MYVASAFDSYLNWFGFSVFLSNVGGSLQALQLPPPKQTCAQKISAKMLKGSPTNQSKLW